jgi:hypothetical protein
MSAAWILFAGCGVFGLFAALWLAWRWLTRSWEVLDDDQLDEKLAGPARQSPGILLLMLGWFSRGPRRLTYRRDERGRFRRIP